MDRERGFTLLETLVALAIAGMAFVALFQAGSTGLFAVDAASRANEAVERAQSRLASLGAGVALIPGDSEGDDGDGYHWHLHVQPVATRLLPAQNGDPAATVTLFDIEVAITWPAGHRLRQVVLKSERLAASGAPQ